MCLCLLLYADVCARARVRACTCMLCACCCCQPGGTSIQYNPRTCEASGSSTSHIYIYIYIIAAGCSQVPLGSLWVVFMGRLHAAVSGRRAETVCCTGSDLLLLVCMCGCKLWIAPWLRMTEDTRHGDMNVCVCVRERDRDGGGAQANKEGIQGQRHAHS